MPPTVAEHLLSVAQEALTNVLRHADATRVRIELAFGEKTLRLLVSDDGQGFDAFGKPAGFGLKGIHERAAKIGGQVDVASILGKGTQIIIMVALPPGVVK
jgi:signal transduction histidine kinase